MQLSRYPTFLLLLLFQTLVRLSLVMTQLQKDAMKQRAHLFRIQRQAESNINLIRARNEIVTRLPERAIQMLLSLLATLFPLF